MQELTSGKKNKKCDYSACFVDELSSKSQNFRLNIKYDKNTNKTNQLQDGIFKVAVV